MERIQGHRHECRIDLQSQPPLHVRKLGRESVQACLILGRGTQLHTWKLASL